MPAKPWAIVTAACGPGPSGTNSHAHSVTLPSTTNSTSRCSAMISPRVVDGSAHSGRVEPLPKSGTSEHVRVWLCGASISSRSSLVDTVQDVTRYVHALHDSWPSSRPVVDNDHTGPTT